MKILVIFGHPSKKSFGRSLTQEYVKGAKEAGHKIAILDLVDLKMEPFLKNTYKEEVALRGALLKSQKQIKWADHLVFFFPIWWATPPALLKTFLEIILQRKFAYKYRRPLLGFIPRWDKLLTGRTARVIMTLGAPPLYYRWILGNPAYKMMKANLNFCGIRPVKADYFGPVEISSEKTKKSWLNKTYQIGLNS